MLFILVPISYIFASICMSVYTKALSHIINEFTLIKISTCMIQFASSII
jgi:hypothetical protein